MKYGSELPATNLGSVDHGAQQTDRDDQRREGVVCFGRLRVSPRLGCGGGLCQQGERRRGHHARGHSIGSEVGQERRGAREAPQRLRRGLDMVAGEPLTQLNQRRAVVLNVGWRVLADSLEHLHHWVGAAPPAR